MSIIYIAEWGNHGEYVIERSRVLDMPFDHLYPAECFWLVPGTFDDNGDPL